MIQRLPIALLTALGLLVTGCARREPPRRPDVVIVTIDRLRWEELGPWGGSVQAPALRAFRDAAVSFDAVVSPGPGGAPAALSVMTGLPPSGHGVRMADDGVLSPDAQTLADRLGAEGWETGAFLQTDQVSLFMQADRGFRAWDAPVPGFPSAHPGASQSRGSEDTIASGLHWLTRLPEAKPGFAWVHLAEPAPPEMKGADRSARLGETLRLLSALLTAAEDRGTKRGSRPIVIICNLSSHGEDSAAAAREAFLLQASALRVRVLASAEGLRPGTVGDLAGLDEVAALAQALATGRGESRLLDLARGEKPGGSRDVIIAETTLPLTCCAAEPRKAALRVQGDASAGDDAAVAASLAADAGWPGGRGAVSGASVLPAFLALDEAWTLARRGRHGEALEAFRAIAASPEGSRPGARTGFGLALAIAGSPTESLAQFQALETEAAAGTLAWSQARLGIALAARASGDLTLARSAIAEMLAASPGDLRALTLLAETAEAGGDRAGAVAAIAALLEHDPDNPFALAELGRLDLALGRPREAADALTRALSRRPTHPGLLLAAAEALAASGDWWSALDRLNERVALYGASFESDLLMGRCWRDTGRFTLAAESFAKAVTARPADPRARLALAESLLFSGSEAEGRAEWTRARELAPADPAPCDVLRSWAAMSGRDAATEAAAAGCSG